MERIHPHLIFSHDTGEQGSRLDPHRLAGKHSLHEVAVRVVGIGVLVQIATKGHVQHLGAPADPEHRFAGREGVVDQSPFQRVPIRIEPRGHLHVAIIERR